MVQSAAQGAKAALSRLHWKVTSASLDWRAKVAEVEAERAGGFAAIEVSGVSTRNRWGALEGPWLPAASVAKASAVWLPWERVPG